MGSRRYPQPLPQLRSLCYATAGGHCPGRFAARAKNPNEATAGLIAWQREVDPYSRARTCINGLVKFDLTQEASLTFTAYISGLIYCAKASIVSKNTR